MRASPIWVAALVTALAGCASPAAPEPAPVPITASPDPGAGEPTASARPSPAATGVFRMPNSCTQMLPESRLEALSAEGYQLLGGPGGLYGDSYYADKTPQQELGGITCIWGSETEDLSVLDLSVAPVTPATRAGIIERLIGQGLNETVLGEAVVYGRFGDMAGAGAVVNAVRNDSWIGVISSFGGQEHYDLATAIATEMAVAVYTSD